MPSNKFSVILLGKTGSGKSASGNTILGRKAFVSKISPKSTTQDITNEKVTISEVGLTVYDTPGLFGTDRGNKQVLNQWNNYFPVNESVVVLLVIRLDRFTEEELKVVEEVENNLKEGLFKNTWILFTGGDELEESGYTIEEFIDGIEALKKIVKRFENRYHVFNNKAMGNQDQVTQLIKKIQTRYCITIPEPSSPHQTSTLPIRRIMLLGKTGVGKSAAGNTILGEERFHSEMSFTSVTCQSELKKSVVAGRQVSVVDTPGLFDTRLSQEDLALEFGRSVYLSCEGVHAFLIVLRVGRYTEQEGKVIQLITTLYGVEALKYAMILFTGGDELEGKSIDQLIKDNSALSDLVQQCGQRYCVFNNKDKTNREQVTTLLEKIDRMVEQNGGSCYTNEMFEDAVRMREPFLNKHWKTFCVAAATAGPGAVIGGGVLCGVVGGLVGLGIGIPLIVAGGLGAAGAASLARAARKARAAREARAAGAADEADAAGAADEAGAPGMRMTTLRKRNDTNEDNDTGEDNDIGEDNYTGDTMSLLPKSKPKKE